jgi:hypothetical protein
MGLGEGGLNGVYWLAHCIALKLESDRREKDLLTVSLQWPVDTLKILDHTTCKFGWGGRPA